MESNVFVYRTLNLKKIKYLGLDMDHTLVRYHTKNFEKLAYTKLLEKLVFKKKYPKSVLELPFEFERAIRGLVLDKKNGNILKLNRYSGIRTSYHGTKEIDFQTQKTLYKSIYIDLSVSDFYPIDTSFSLSPAILFAQLVDLKDNSLKDALPSYTQIADDILSSLDDEHRDGSIKKEVHRDVAQFIIQDKEVVSGLEAFKKSGKKIFIVTNSYYDYSKLLLDFAIQPFLKDHKHWSELFEFIVTGAQKPRFFYEEADFFPIDLKTGTINSSPAQLTSGIFQGGCANSITSTLDLGGDDILYMGDHIYGDILRLKKDCNWRTGLVIEDLFDEIQSLEKAKPINDKISSLMIAKEPFEKELLKISSSTIKSDATKKQYDSHMEEITKIDSQLSSLIQQHQELFNTYWGEIMRIGNEESFFASQVERYACIYMPRLADLVTMSPKTYFRGHRRTMPHEM